MTVIKYVTVIHKELIYGDAGQFCEAKIAPQAVFDIQVYVAGWSSSVARWAHNPKVAGSNPAPATNSRKALFRNEEGFFCVNWYYAGTA